MGFILFYDYYTNLEHALKHVTVEQQNYRNAREKIKETILLQNKGLSLQLSNQNCHSFVYRHKNQFGFLSKVMQNIEDTILQRVSPQQI